MSTHASDSPSTLRRIAIRVSVTMDWASLRIRCPCVEVALLLLSPWIEVCGPSSSSMSCMVRCTNRTAPSSASFDSVLNDISRRRKLVRRVECTHDLVRTDAEKIAFLIRAGRGDDVNVCVDPFVSLVLAAPGSFGEEVRIKEASSRLKSSSRIAGDAPPPPLPYRRWNLVRLGACSVFKERWCR